MSAANPLLYERIPKLIRQIGLPVGIGVLFYNLFQLVRLVLRAQADAAGIG